MKFKRCDMRDLARTAEFYDAVVWNLCQNVNYPKWIYGEYPSMKSTKAAIQKGEQFACMQGETIIGAYVLNTDPQGDYSSGKWTNDLKIGEYMVIHALAVSSAMTGKGIGKEIVEHCIEHARQQNFKAVRIDVVPENIPARRLYEKLGFAFAGERDLNRNIAGIPLFALYEFNF